MRSKNGLIKYHEFVTTNCITSRKFHRVSEIINSNSIDLDKLLTKNELSELLNIRLSEMWLYMKIGLPFTVVDKECFYKLRDVLNFFNKYYGLTISYS